MRRQGRLSSAVQVPRDSQPAAEDKKHFQLTVFGNPIPKARARVVKGHAFTPKRTAIYEKMVRVAALAIGITPSALPISLTVYFWRESHHRCDLDNLVKSVKDALNGIAWLDDSQVVELRAFKGVDKHSPRCCLIVETCGDAMPSLGNVDAHNVQAANPKT